MNVNPGRALVYCKKLIKKRCSLCEIGAAQHKAENGDYQHRITVQAMTVVARCDASEILKFLKGETNVVE